LGPRHYGDRLLMHIPERLWHVGAMSSLVVFGCLLALAFSSCGNGDDGGSSSKHDPLTPTTTSNAQRTGSSSASSGGYSKEASSTDHQHRPAQSPQSSNGRSSHYVHENGAGKKGSAVDPQVEDVEKGSHATKGAPATEEPSADSPASPPATTLDTKKARR
jgi:hypothetical protein